MRKHIRRSLMAMATALALQAQPLMGQMPVTGGLAGPDVAGDAAAANTCSTKMAQPKLAPPEVGEHSQRRSRTSTTRLDLRGGRAQAVVMRGRVVSAC